MKPDTDDDRLMALTARGEEAAFRLLVQRWEADVRAFLIHMLGSVEEAEDLAQDTFVQVYRQADRFEGRGMFRSWLLRIAGNLARSRLRRRKIVRWVHFDGAVHDPPSSASGPLAALEEDETARAVRAAVDSLPERQKQALVLHRYQGLKYREVAVAMDTTIPGVESLIQRALATLRTRLAGQIG